MRQFCCSIAQGEQEIVATGLGILLEGAVGEVDKNREIGKGAGDLGMRDGDGYAVKPDAVIPWQWVSDDEIAKSALGADAHGG